VEENFLMLHPLPKVSMMEYEDISIKVGDKVTIKIKKAESSGI
jgi:hypothetical protein